MGWGMALNITGAERERFESSRMNEDQKRRIDIKGQRNTW